MEDVNNLHLANFHTPVRGLYVTLVVEYICWNDYHFGNSTVRLFLPGRGEHGRIGWEAVQDCGTSESMSTQPSHPVCSYSMLSSAAGLLVSDLVYQRHE